MEFFLAGFAVLLPWACGYLLLTCASRWLQRAPGVPFALGYGFPIGIVLLILWMRFLAFAGLIYSPWTLGIPFASLFVGFSFALYKAPRLAAVPPGKDEWRALPLWGKFVWWGLLALLTLRGAQFLLEIAWRPSFGWDAWAHWATKAKVWFSLGTIVPFGSATEVLAGTVQYTDANPHYPPGIPLVQVWVATWVGHWNDTLVNLPWIGFALALGLGFYAQLRASAAGPLFAMGSTYFLLSLPFFNVQIALPGYADLPLAVFVGLATISFWRWSVERRIEQLVLALVLALSGPMLKTPGWVWLALMVPAALPALFGNLGWRLVFATGATAAITLFVLAHYQPLLVGYQLHARFHPVWKPLAETTLLINNWHLLWYGALLAPILFGRALFTPRLATLTVYLAGALGFLFVVFFFSNAALWVSDLSTVNRALLHLTPTLLFAMALLALDFKERMQKAKLPREIITSASER